jgi:hypothetical protein
MNDILSYLHFQVCSRIDGRSSGLLAFSKGRERRIDDILSLWHCQGREN